MNEDQNPNQDAELEGLVQRMLDANESKDSIDAVIRVYDDEKHPIRAALSGGVKGAAHGVMGALTAPWDLAKGTIVDAISMAKGETPENAKALLDSLGNLPKQWAEGGVRERSEMLGGLLGSIGTGVAAGKTLPTSLPPLARTTGKALQYAGEHPFATRLAGGASVVAGVTSGRPELVAGGLAAQAIPAVATKAGQALRIYGGESPAVVRLGKPAVAKLNSQFDEAMVKRGMSFIDERADAAATAAKATAKESANVARLAKIEEATAGLEPTKPTVRESVSAELPDGTRTSMSHGFKKPGEEAAASVGNTSAAEVAKLKAQGMSDATIAKIIAADPGTRNVAPVLGGGPTAPKPSIRITGKAATDLAEGKVPTASAAPMPSDTRLEELAGKLGGQAPGTPKPARITTQEAIPASKSKGPMSATPNLTRADLEAVGLNPALNYKDLTPEMVDRIKSLRSSRHGTNYANAVTDKGLRANKSDMMSILEQSLLMRNMEKLR